jgi:hypothetical protein
MQQSAGPWSSAMLHSAGLWSSAMPHSDGLFFTEFVWTYMIGPTLCGIAQDHGPELCCIARDKIA